ncbi:MAG TPA: GLPGLI family protein, partial [Chitinophagaceae bacterium]|nr:GLPGLI family protein [Chitinophagaceae bacterium]
MKKIVIAALLLVAFGSGVQAQATFFGRVKIEFEKTVYVHQLYKEVEPEWYDRIKERLPVTSITYSEFIGDTATAVYKPGREVETDSRSWYRPMADKNVVYTDFTQGKTISQKPVFEETFLIEDSLAKIAWKLTADTRIIAGYECRKAIGIMNDSIAVFAFYTEEILVPGGPESIHGLPGMILGMGVPRLHTTWFATRVEVNGVNMSPVKPATKGKKVTRQSMISQIDK